MAEKRYFAIVMPQGRFEAISLAGYDRGSKVIHSRGQWGFALDYYPDEAVSYQREFGEGIIGDFATRGEAMVAILVRMHG